MVTVSVDIPRSRFGIWLAGVSFVLFQFFMQLSSGVVIGAIMQNMHLTALTAGLLGSSLYVIYTTLQIPVGILFDRKNSRSLLAINAFLCSIGCFVFAASDSLAGLFIGRFLMGAGSAFAFVGFSHILRQYFPIKQFAFMIGFSETLAFIITVIGMISMGKVISSWGWRYFIIAAGMLGLFISCLCWINIPNSPRSSKPTPDYGQQIIQILKNGKAWINGLFVGLCFIIVTVFGALWAVPFLQVKLAGSLQEATILVAFFFLGAGVSCPLFGMLSNWFNQRRPLILSSCLSTTILFLALLYLPLHNPFVIGLLMFIMGCCCGAYMLAYTIANELAPADLLSTCTGFTNTLAVLTVPIFQTLIGYLLDIFNQKGQYTLGDYQMALLTIPGALLIASILVLFLPEKTERNPKN
ncbi:MFS transporter [Legionella oakridgensis]|uniref:Lysosomal dipeptide transporter MFSD1 n=2 Tax=Legionella oakridgensis TaxID=29423 RepID=W0BGI5_9GAMM|nr:MFS transporter [Legionella oakridgensis]AHE67732.1 sugar phosphate permease [Legionella oakridgensis ATCC 33761 = DSM 21215]KTD36938.1 major facilitator family transporter [Legionella oakridgensis]STY20753.1 major facilitator family transporter [Legionella longbeachae]